MFFIKAKEFPMLLCSMGKIRLFQAHRKMYLFQLRTVREDAGLRFLHAARNMYMSASVWTYQIDEYL